MARGDGAVAISMGWSGHLCGVWAASSGAAVKQGRFLLLSVGRAGDGGRNQN